MLPESHVTGRPANTATDLMGLHVDSANTVAAPRALTAQPRPRPPGRITPDQIGRVAKVLHTAQKGRVSSALRIAQNAFRKRAGAGGDGAGVLSLSRT